MKIRPVGPQIGVGVSGVDVRILDDSAFATIYRAWLDHGILVVTGQELTIPEFPRYSHQFGMVEPHPSKSTRWCGLRCRTVTSIWITRSWKYCGPVRYKMKSADA